MRKIILLTFGCLFFTVLNAQTPVCTPDQRYKDSTSVVYPTPFDATLNPKGGIDRPACLGIPYSFVFTLRVPDTFATNALGIPLRLRMDSASIGTTGAISGLPAGITYACNPPNCIFKPKTLGCVVLRGTTTAPIAVYKLSFKLKAFIELFPGGYEINYPDASIAPGEYNLRVVAATDAACRSSSTFDVTEIASMKAAPNPANLATTINIEAVESGDYRFEVTNLVGQSVFNTPLSMQRGLNSFELDTSELPNGIYMYTLSKGNKKLSHKLIVSK
jgi:hypothetical protein